MLTSTNPRATILAADDIWRIVAFFKNSNQLPPETQPAWQAAASR